ncbi:PREDICTED: heat shock 70 kDa protein 12A-like [Amphimedon queenslandica]|uniref:Uncharacterized protein n=1 Tax=Amphimedon queenslandica TaxID=400682 RepID=A0AAN0J9V8_AMPQE|nr:PREDICTED: heat shock 70 kDa protein 12A-like [Amphimedon queenslandica]|eukprot:XP_019853789.1 PREDICTED: heat shock 70 kDa protein 12A-like [Amphimedon queenslandica]
MPLICIKLQNPWNEAKISGLRILIERLLPKELRQSIMKCITIEPGSVVIKLHILDITADSLIEYTGGNLYINDHPVLEEDENMNFTFELALLEAVTAGNNERADFLCTLRPPLSQAEKIQTPTPRLQESNCIAAIDFGTSSLSVAYTTPTDDQIRLVPLHSTLERVPNAILIMKDQKNQQCEVIGIGNMAQSIMYCSDLKKGAKNFIYFERIKNLLERDNSVNRTTEVSSFTGGSYYLIEVIAFILTHLKEKLLTDELKEVYKSTDFDWVITVPAIWKARARRMMREAAYMAGLTSDAPGITRFTPVGSPLPRPEEVNPEKLSLALEPEVAAIYAQHQSEVSGTPPQRYMVVDIGGGTVDITVHDKSNRRISVVLPPMGNTWGGTTINETPTAF